MENKVSIIMPVYNAENFLEKTIESIRLQTYQDFELIIINDGSTDNSLSICQKYANKDQRIKLFTTHNQGICNARNLGLKMARGKYICFSDHDDILHKDLLKDNIYLMNKHNSQLIKFMRTEYILNNEKLTATKKYNQNFKNYKDFNLKDSFFELLNNDLLTFVWDSIFLKDIIEKNKIFFDTNFIVGNEDIDFSIQYLKYCKSIIINNKAYYNHYARLGVSTSSKFSTAKIDTSIYLGEKLISFICDNNISVSYFNYTYAITRMILNPICRNLTEAKNNISLKKKINILSDASKKLLKNRNIHFSEQKNFGNSRKIMVYRFFFIHNLITIILIFDMILKKVVDFIRKFK